MPSATAHTIYKRGSVAGTNGRGAINSTCVRQWVDGDVISSVRSTTSVGNGIRYYRRSGCNTCYYTCNTYRSYSSIATAPCATGSAISEG